VVTKDTKARSVVYQGK